MGLCCSKKEPPAKPGKVAAAVISDGKAKRPAQQPKRAAASKSAVLVVKASAAAAAAPGEDEKKKKNKRAGVQEAAPAAKQQPLPVVVVPSAPVRTSSCTKEEVDAILIQCGRLSRSSSGAGRAASSDAGHRRRRSSGSKRSYDFDQQGGVDEECEWERQGAAAAVSRPSPHRGSPQRRRSGSRERSGGGGGSGSRRASRSPGRRADGAAASVVAAAAGSGGGERVRQQPGKMVSVPAREKGRAPSPVPAASGKRCASPRASSPARAPAGNENAGGGPALSRSSSRKAEQSPYRRSPMAEIDENTLRNNGNHNAKPQKKSAETAVAAAATPKKAAVRGKVPTAEMAEDATVAASETRAHSSKTIATRSATASIVAESLGQRPAGQPGCRSRRASRDLDHNPGSYATQLLEDIQNYHQQSTSATPATPSLSLPACVAKACSIVEAVADLNSSSENRTYEYEPGLSADDKGSVNLGSDGCVEAASKHVTPAARDFRVETEPQESAGSNSVSGHPCPWTPSWEPTSVESTDRTWRTSDEVVEQSGSHGGRCSPTNRPRQSKQRPSQHEPGSRSRAGSGNGSSLYRGRSAHRGTGSVASGRCGVRVVSATS